MKEWALGFGLRAAPTAVWNNGEAFVYIWMAYSINKVELYRFWSNTTCCSFIVEDFDVSALAFLCLLFLFAQYFCAQSPSKELSFCVSCSSVCGQNSTAVCRKDLVQREHLKLKKCATYNTSLAINLKYWNCLKNKCKFAIAVTSR